MICETSQLTILYFTTRMSLRPITKKNKIAEHNSHEGEQFRLIHYLFTCIGREKTLCSSAHLYVSVFYIKTYKHKQNKKNINVSNKLRKVSLRQINKIQISKNFL